MDQPFSDVFARHGCGGTPKNQEEMSRALDEACRKLARALAACSPIVRRDLLAAIASRAQAFLDEMDARARQVPTSPERPTSLGTPSDGTGPGGSPPPGSTDGFPVIKLPPEVLEWERQQVNEEEIVAGLREIEQTGGLELRDFLHELEQAAGPDE
jgi:hypothetical protein